MKITKPIVVVIVIVILAAIGWKYRAQIQSKLNSITGA